MANDLLNHEDYTWNVYKIRLVCSEDDTGLLLRAKRPVKYALDTPIWTPVAIGLYTTAVGFDFLSRTYHPDYSNTFSHQFSWKDFLRTKAPKVTSHCLENLA